MSNRIPSPRRVVTVLHDQSDSTYNALLAVCADGTVWRCRVPPAMPSGAGAAWTQVVGGIPGSVTEVDDV